MVNTAKVFKSPENSQAQTGCDAPHLFHTLSLLLDSVDREEKKTENHFEH